MSSLTIILEYEDDEPEDVNDVNQINTERPATAPQVAAPPPNKQPNHDDPDESVTEPEEEELDWLEADTPGTAAGSHTSSSLCIHGTNHHQCSKQWSQASD